MLRTSRSVACAAAAYCLSVSLACSVDTPLTPAPAPGSSPTAAADGSTLKVGAPTLVSPINSEILTTQRPTLAISAAVGLFATANFQYEFELQTDAGAVVTRATVSGSTFTVPDNLGINAAFRWRARATLNGAFGPYSSLGRFQTPRLTTPTAASSNDEWKNWFFQVVDLRGVGPIVTVQALIALDPDLKAASVIQETNSAGQPRGRLYLPTGNPNNLFGRSVDLGDFGRPWRWEPKGSTVCEGGSCK